MKYCSDLRGLLHGCESVCLASRLDIFVVPVKLDHVSNASMLLLHTMEPFVLIPEIWNLNMYRTYHDSKTGNNWVSSHVLPFPCDYFMSPSGCVDGTR